MSQRVNVAVINIKRRSQRRSASQYAVKRRSRMSHPNVRRAQPIYAANVALIYSQRRMRSCSQTSQLLN